MCGCLNTGLVLVHSDEEDFDDDDDDEDDDEDDDDKNQTRAAYSNLNTALLPHEQD